LLYNKVLEDSLWKDLKKKKVNDELLI